MPLYVIFLNIFVGYLELSKALPFQCPAGVWGSRCDRDCGNCEGGIRFCELHNGICYNGCQSGYKGALCTKKCPAGTHGLYCKDKCGYCSTDTPVCNPTNGECLKGCIPGYQGPLCKLTCPYQTWGTECTKRCNCPATPKCGCDPVSGRCFRCDAQGEPKSIVMTVQRSSMDIPWVPITSFLGLIGFFVLTNFLYWCFCLRVRGKGRSDVRVYRDKKPKQLKVQEWKTLFEGLQLADRKLRIRSLAKSNAKKSIKSRRTQS